MFYEFLKRKEIFDYCKDITAGAYDESTIEHILKDKLPGYQETITEWKQRLSGDYRPSNNASKKRSCPFDDGVSPKRGIKELLGLEGEHSNTINKDESISNHQD